MNRKASSICSTTRAAAILRAFSSLWMRAWLPALCWVLGLMLSGAWVGVYAQTAHFVRAQSAHANASNNNLGSRVSEVTSSNGNFGTVNVGSKSTTPISMIFTFDTAGTLGSTTVVTQGATGLDFTDAGTGTCKAGTAYGSGATCTINVSFSPKLTGTRYGAANLLDGSGNVLATGYVQGTGVGPQVNFLPGTQSVIAADTSPSSFAALAVDSSGNVYIAEYSEIYGESLVLKETPSAGGYTKSVVANNLYGPNAIAVDGSGSVYIADLPGPTNPTRILKETPSAGGYTESVVASPYWEDSIGGIAVDGSGNIYYPDSYNRRVLKETLSAGGYTESVVADSANGLGSPWVVAVDGNGNVYIVDGQNICVLKETPSAGGYTQSVVANAASNGLSSPMAIAVDGSGNIYISDFIVDSKGNGTYRMLKETPSEHGYMQNVVPFSGFVYLSGFAVDGGGNVYFSDSSTYLGIIKDDFADPPNLTFVPTGVGGTSTDSPQTVTVSNNGNAALTFPLPATGDNPSVPDHFAWDPASTCVQTTAGSSAAFQLAAGASCTMAFDFKPTVLGKLSGLAELTDNNLNVVGAVQGIQLTGTGVEFSQTITFPQPVSPVYYGAAPITLSATGGASGNPVIFSLLSGPGTLSGTNNSVLNFTGPGTIVIAANQAGNANYAAAAQVTRSITVLGSTLAVLTAPSPQNELDGPNVTFTWSPGVGPTAYMLYLGSTGVGSNNLYNSGSTTATSVNVTGLPINGEKIFARLSSFIGGAWYYHDYTYTAVARAMLTSPAPGSTLAGSNVTFTWSAGVDVTLYYLLLGSNGVGSDNLYNSGYTAHRSVNVTGLPTNGETIYARIYSSRAGRWHYLDYTYTAELLVTLTSPAPDSTLTGSSVTFSWSGGVGITKYYLLLGSNGVGSDNLYNSGYTTHKSVNVTGLPTNGETIYARLYWYVNGAWHHADTTYTAE